MDERKCGRARPVFGKQSLVLNLPNCGTRFTEKFFIMPSKSPAQARLMAAAAHTPGGYDGVPQSVGREFNQADKGTDIRKAKRNARPQGWRGKKSRSYTGA